MSNLKDLTTSVDVKSRIESENKQLHFLLKTLVSMFGGDNKRVVVPKAKRGQAALGLFEYDLEFFETNSGDLVLELNDAPKRVNKLATLLKTSHEVPTPDTIRAAVKQAWGFDLDVS